MTALWLTCVSRRFLSFHDCYSFFFQSHIKYPGDQDVDRHPGGYPDRGLYIDETGFPQKEIFLAQDLRYYSIFETDIRRQAYRKQNKLPDNGQFIVSQSRINPEQQKEVIKTTCIAE